MCNGAHRVLREIRRETRIYTAIYRYTDMCVHARVNGTLMDPLSEFKLTFVQETFIPRASCVPHIFVLIKAIILEITCLERFPVPFRLPTSQNFSNGKF